MKTQAVIRAAFDKWRGPGQIMGTGRDLVIWDNETERLFDAFKEGYGLALDHFLAGAIKTTTDLPRGITKCEVVE